MLPLLVLLAHAQSRSDAPNAAALRPLEGVWASAEGNFLFVGNGRLDWKVEDRYYSAVADSVPDGSLLGSFMAGRELYVSFETHFVASASDPLEWSSEGSVDYRGPDGFVRVSVPHLGPDPRTFPRPAGEARIGVRSLNGRGVPAVILVATTVQGSHTPTGVTYTRAMPLDGLTMAGKFADKDETLDWDGDAGRVGAVHGSFTYLGQRYSVSGRRIMGRVGFVMFDDSRKGVRGVGYAVFSPTPNRASQMLNGDSKVTDGIDVAFRLEDGSTSFGIHKTLKRLAP